MSTEVPQITALSDPPKPTDPLEVFNDKAFRSLSEQTQFVTEANALAVFVNAEAESARQSNTDAQQAKSDAQTANGAAQQAKDDAQTANGAAQQAKDDAEDAAEEAQRIAHEFGDLETAMDAAELAKTTAVDAKDAALAAKSDSELARDAAIATAGPLYETEAAGRAAVSNGQTFSVQGEGDVAAFIYRRVSSSQSTLITSLPASASVRELREMVHAAVWDQDVAFGVAFEDGSRTWLESRKNGMPTHHAAETILETVGIKPVSTREDMGAALVTTSGQMLCGWEANGNPLFTGSTPYVASGFVAYGDSTTYGDGLTATYSERWTTLLGKRLGVHIENRGVNGAASGDIAARYGAVVPEMVVSGGSIPASGNVTLTAIHLNPARGAGSVPVELLCEGGERVSGRITHQNFGAATFTRASAGSAITTGRVKVISKMSALSRRRILFIGMGVNDEPYLVAGTTKMADVKSYYRSMALMQAAAKPHIVAWGMLDRGLAEAAGTAIGDFILELEDYLTLEFGCCFAPVRKFLASSYGFAIAKKLQPGFTETTADSDSVAAGVTPPSYRVGGTSVHLNSLGHQLQAWFFHQHLIGRGLA